MGIRILCRFLCSCLVIYFCFAIDYNNRSPSLQGLQFSSVSMLLDMATRETSFETLSSIAVLLSAKIDKADSKAINDYMALLRRVEVALNQDIGTANYLIQDGRFSDASAIYEKIIDTGSVLLDNRTISVCYQLHGKSLFREAMVGNATWGKVAHTYNMLSKLRPLDESEEYNYNMAKTSAKIQSLESSSTFTPQLGAPRSDQPYVLYFHIPQNAQTPSVGHFGHVRKYTYS
jgi:hypothetical protein